MSDYRNVFTAPAVLLSLAWAGPLAVGGLCQAPPPAPAKRAAAGTLKPEVYANLGQLMRGLLFPNSNVVFAAQDEDPAKVAPAKDPSLATIPLASSCSGKVSSL